MKRTDTITKITAVLLFIALILYVGAYMVRAMKDPMQTATVVSTTIQDKVSTYGIIAREEQVLRSTYQYINIVAEDGKRVSAGNEIALSYSSEDALDTAGRVRELELEIIRVQTLLDSIVASDELLAYEAKAREAVTDLTGAVNRHELGELDSKLLRLKSLMFDSQNTQEVSETDLRKLQSELDGLMRSMGSSAVEIDAPESGVFTLSADGFEGLSLETAEKTSPEYIKALLEEGRTPDESTIGKLVTSSVWYYVTVISEEDAELLEENNLTLDFGRYYSSAIDTEIYSLGPSENGEQVAVFKCTTALADTLALRKLSADVIYKQYTGMRVPKKAIYKDESEEKQTFLYTLTATRAEAKAVDILCSDGDYCIVQSAPNGTTLTLDETQSVTAMLREGNEVIVTAGDIFNGKVMG